MNIKKRILYIIFSVIVGIILSAGFVKAATTLFGYQGGTGFSTSTTSTVGYFLQISSTSPYLTYTFASALTATPTLQQVTNAGAVTTNQIQFAGGTSTAALVVQGLLTAPTGSFTYTDATTTNATFATVGTLIGSNTTITNVSSTNMSVSSSLLVTGKAVCLADGTNCLPTTTPTLQQVATAGNTTSLALIFAGGTSTANFVVTGTLNAQTTTLGQTAITNGLSVVGNATISGNATSSNFFATNLSGTNISYTSATGTNHTITNGTVTNLTSSNVTITGGTINGTSIGATTPSTGVFTNATSTNLFATTGTFTNVAVTAAITGASLAISGNATIGGTLGVTGVSTLATTTVTNFTASNTSTLATTTVTSLTVSGTSTLAGTTATVLSVSGASTLTGAATLGSTLSVAGVTTLATTTVTNFTASRTSTLATTTATTLTLSSPLAWGSGGSNNTSYTTNGVIIASTSMFVATATGTANQVLTSNGGSTAPTFQTIPAATFGSSSLASTYDVTDSYGDTGLSITLPSAGTYDVTAIVRGQTAYGSGLEGYLNVKLYNATDAVDVSETEMIVGYEDVAGVVNIEQITMFTSITVTASKTIKLYAVRSMSSPILSQIVSDSTGRTKIFYKKTSN